MQTYQIKKDTPYDHILDTIHEDVIEDKNKYTLLEFDEQWNHEERSKLVSDIKRFYDIFIILKVPVPGSTQVLEEYFSYGIHGIYFENPHQEYSLQELDMMSKAVDLFMNGCVFVSICENSSMIVDILDRKMIPYGCFEDQNTIAKIKNHHFFSEISSNLLQYIPYGNHNKLCFSFKDKIKMKVLIETMNLRQKLMIKSINDSFNSSGL